MPACAGHSGILADNERGEVRQPCEPATVRERRKQLTVHLPTGQRRPSPPRELGVSNRAAHADRFEKDRPGPANGEGKVKHRRVVSREKRAVRAMIVSIQRPIRAECRRDQRVKRDIRQRSVWGLEHEICKRIACRSSASDPNQACDTPAQQEL